MVVDPPLKTIKMGPNFKVGSEGRWEMMGPPAGVIYIYFFFIKELKGL